MDPNDEIIPLQEKEKDMSSSQESSSKESPHDEYHEDNLLCVQLQDSDGNIQKKDACSDPQILYNSSIFQVNEDDGTCYAECHDIIFPEDELNDSVEDEDLGGWFKITIPNGRKYSKMWIINLLQTHCSVAFTPVDFQYIRNHIQFFVQNPRSAYELKNINYQLSDEENRKISVYVNSSTEPLSVQYKLTSEQTQILKLSMKKRYNVFRKSLYLRKFRFDPDLTDHGIDIFLNRRSCMTATLEVIQADYPELLSLNLSNNKIYWLDGLSELIERAPQVKILDLSRNLLKTAWELEKMKGLKLKELWLEGNPLCSTFPDHSAYVRAVLNYFPELSRLDGRKLPLSSVRNIEEPQLMKPCKESFKGSEAVKTQVQQFLREYYWIYDYGERQGLLSVYHDQACFSLTIPFDPSDPDLSGTCGYFKDEVNMKNPKEFYVQRQLLKYTKEDIVDFIRALPKTLHASSSFQVDMCFQTETMLCFSVKGVFKEEVEGSSQGCIRAFMRTFIAILDRRSSNLCIVNDQLFVRHPSPDEIQDSFAIPSYTSCSGFKFALSQEQQRMVQAFSTQSGMKLEWSQKCLEDNKWDYTRAAEVFTMLQTESKIPREFFGQMT